MLIQLLLVLLLFAVVHLSFIAIAANSMRVGIKKIVFGYGPTLFHRGRLTIKALPFGGEVGVVDSSGSDQFVNRSIDYMEKPFSIQLLIALSGCIASLLVALAADWYVSIDSLVNAVFQIPLGAMFPLSLAQQYLDHIVGVYNEQSASLMIAVIFPKLIVFHLLPLPMSNGGYVVRLVIIKFYGVGSVLAKGFNYFVYLYVAIGISWWVAIAFFLWRHYAV